MPCLGVALCTFSFSSFTPLLRRGTINSCEHGSGNGSTSRAVEEHFSRREARINACVDYYCTLGEGGEKTG